MAKTRRFAFFYGYSRAKNGLTGVRKSKEILRERILRIRVDEHKKRKTFAKALHMIYNSGIYGNERSITQMATVNYSLRVDEEDKQRAEQVFRPLGMTLSTGINIYLKAVGRQQKIPFELTLGGQVVTSPASGIPHTDKGQSFNALDGFLAGHTVDLDREKAERILSK
jgi:addiction module RelB/DinJ family antitoxin